MNWESVGAFIEMGGYGTYVWSSFIVTAICFALEIVALSVRRRHALRELERRD
jgi:heme exporter protein D